MSSQTGVLRFQVQELNDLKVNFIYDHFGVPPRVLSVSLFILHLSQCMRIILEFWKHSTALLRWRSR